jgi:hypothetical protein
MSDNLFNPNDQDNPLDEVESPLPPLQLEVIPGTAYDVLNLMHDQVIQNLLRGERTVPCDLPSLWRLAKHVVNERGPLNVYRYSLDPSDP